MDEVDLEKICSSLFSTNTIAENRLTPRACTVLRPLIREKASLFQRANSAAINSLMDANILLSKLNSEEHLELVAELKIVHLDVGEYLPTSGEFRDCIWFPVSCVISLVLAMDTGHRIFCGIVGREGALGFNEASSGRSTIASAVANVSGVALILTSKAARRLMEQDKGLVWLLRRHAAMLHEQTMLLVGCNAVHVTEARLARFLLSIVDRIGCQTPLHFTQEALADGLGVQRSMVNACAASMQGLGLIRYRRGAIQVLDRAGLAEISCYCYRTTCRLEEETFGINGTIV